MKLQVFHHNGQLAEFPIEAVTGLRVILDDALEAVQHDLDALNQAFHGLIDKPGVSPPATVTVPVPADTPPSVLADPTPAEPTPGDGSATTSDAATETLTSPAASPPDSGSAPASDAPAAEAPAS